MLFIILLAIVLIIILSFYSLRYNSAKYKGIRGEAVITNVLVNLNKEHFITINNLLIKTAKGSSQIDHVVISIYGIFVIETKNYTGWIHGHEKAEYWTQTIYNHRERFRNPIKQNWAHIYALKSILQEYKDIAYYPIIVFTSNAELKNISSNIPVIYDYELPKTIYKIGRKQCLSINEINRISKKLYELNVTDLIDLENHIDETLQKRMEKEHKESLRICPQCNARLVVRKGPYGEFYGCSNYPTCKYTLNL